jgi:hypothetical protein
MGQAIASEASGRETLRDVDNTPPSVSRGALDSSPACGGANEDAGGPSLGGPREKNLQALVGAAGWARLPDAVIARFGGAALDAEYAGEGRFEANWAGRVFARLGLIFGRPLPAHVGAAKVFIRVTQSAAGEAWTRIYCFAGGDEIVRSVKHAGRGAWLEERAGPLIMRLKVFEEKRALVFDCIDFLLRFGPLELPLPIELTPGRIRVEHHDFGGGRFAFTLEARHPWFGVTFRQICELRDVGGRP